MIRFLLLLVLVLGSASCAKKELPPLPESEFSELPAKALSDRSPLVVAGHSSQGLAALIGLIFIVDEDSPSGVYDRRSTVRGLRPAAGELATETLNKSIFEGRVASGVTGTVSALESINFELSAGKAAEVLIRDEVRVGYADIRKIPYDKLTAIWEKTRQAPEFKGKRLLFVESVYQTTVTLRAFEKWDLDVGGGYGVFFRVGADIYSSSGSFEHRTLTWVDAFDIGETGQLLSVGNSGEGTSAARERREAARLLRRNSEDLDAFSLADATSLRDYLVQQSQESKHKALGNALVDIDEVSSPFFFVDKFAQDASNRCWATVAAMMLSWHRGEHITPAEAAKEGGPKYKRKYDDNGTLQSGAEKDDFIRALGMTYGPAASLSAKGLDDLVRLHGPAWFTTEELGRHALLVLGVQGTGDGQTTLINFVDPADGKSRVEVFDVFMREYVSSVVKELGEKSIVVFPPSGVTFKDGSFLPFRR